MKFTEVEEKLLKAIEDYRVQLYDDPKVSATKFMHMQTALYGVKCILNDVFEHPRKREIAWIKH